MAYPKSSYKKSGWCALPYLSPFPFYTSIQMKMGVKREREEFGISLCFGPSKKNNGKRQLTLRKLLVKWARERERYWHQSMLWAFQKDNGKGQLTLRKLLMKWAVDNHRHLQVASHTILIGLLVRPWGQAADNSDTSYMSKIAAHL